MAVSGQKLGLWHNVIISLAFMAPALSLLATFSFVMVAGYSWVATPLAYLMAGIVSIITSVAFAELIKAYPFGGSLWTFGSKVIGPRFGQFAVWIYLLEILVVPAAALIPVGLFAFDWLGIPAWITVLIGFAVIAPLTIRGIQLSFRTIAMLFLAEMAILVAFAVSSIYWSIGAGTYSFMASEAVVPSGSLFGWAGIMLGATVAIFSYIGFESSVNLAEETTSSIKNTSRAVILSAVTGTIIVTFLAWAFVLAIPTKGLFSLLTYVNPVPAMAGVIWGSSWQGVIDLAGIMGGFTAALASVTAGSRLFQKLGEEGVVPGVFKKTSPKYATPIIAILFMSAVGLLLSEFTPWETILYVIATGAIPAFIITNFLAFWHYKGQGHGPKNILLHDLLPWAGIGLSSWFVLVGLPPQMKGVLALWIAVGILLVYLNSTLRPRAFQRLGAFVPKSSFIGLGLSVLLVAIVAVAFGVWYTFFSGGIHWWYEVAPYASGNALATVVTALAIISLLAFSTFTLRRKEVEVTE